jgi:tripeptide aminopeptidase
MSRLLAVREPTFHNHQPMTTNAVDRFSRPLKDGETLRLATDLMAITGPSGRERDVVDWIRNKLQVEGGAPDSAIFLDSPPKSSSIDGDAGNLVLTLPGTVRRPRRLFVAHVDTVPICAGAKPVRRNGRVVSGVPGTGLGADNRAGSAVLLATALDVLRTGVAHPPLTFLWTVQEEVGLRGARDAKLSKLGKCGLAFNFDGGSPAKLTIGATGGHRLRIDIIGMASHAGGAPAEGVSAIAIAALAIAKLVKSGWHGQITKGRHSGTSNVGVIQGGQATNVVADHAYVRAEARSHDSRFRQRIVDEMEKAFRAAAAQVCNLDGRCGKVVVEGQLDYDSFRLSPREPCVQAAQAAVAAAGLEPELAVANGGLDANWLTARGIPTVTLGCGQHRIHTAQEELDVAEFQAARRIALRLATDIG